jgi:hypothetical protein
MKKLAIYDYDLGAESKAILLDSNTSPLRAFQVILELRDYAKNCSINGWINEYDLNWSTTQCANKHDL